MEVGEKGDIQSEIAIAYVGISLSIADHHNCTVAGEGPRDLVIQDDKV